MDLHKKAGLTQLAQFKLSVSFSQYSDSLNTYQMSAEALQYSVATGRRKNCTCAGRTSASISSTADGDPEKARPAIELAVNNEKNGDTVGTLVAWGTHMCSIDRVGHPWVTCQRTLPLLHK